MASPAVGFTPPPFTLDWETALSLGLAFSLMPLAQGLTASVLPASTPRKYYYLFMWHAYDFLTHFLIEGSFLYHCFFSYTEIPSTDSGPLSSSELHPHLFNRPDRRYGAWYSSGPMARLWSEYAKSDRRWGGADLGIISIEIVTVFLDGPGAVYICYLIAKIMNNEKTALRNQYKPRLWFAAIIVACLELVGGFYTFCPEWLSGNHALADGLVYVWLYLVFFNMIWVFVPLWVLWVAYTEISTAFSLEGEARNEKSAKKRK